MFGLISTFRKGDKLTTFVVLKITFNVYFLIASESGSMVVSCTNIL